jgi:hypothetical protein
MSHPANSTDCLKNKIKYKMLSAKAWRGNSNIKRNKIERELMRKETE